MTDPAKPVLFVALSCSFVNSRVFSVGVACASLEDPRKVSKQVYTWHVPDDEWARSTFWTLPENRALGEQLRAGARVYASAREGLAAFRTLISQLRAQFQVRFVSHSCTIDTGLLSAALIDQGLLPLWREDDGAYAEPGIDLTTWIRARFHVPFEVDSIDAVPLPVPLRDHTSVAEDDAAAVLFTFLSCI